MKRTIPTEEDWQTNEKNFDMKCAYQIYSGKSNDDMQSEFKRNSLERCFDLKYMPFEAFKYYIFGFKQYIETEDFGQFDKPDAVSCFIELVREKLISDYNSMMFIINELMPTVEMIAKNQEYFEADIDIYGDFKEVFTDIKKLVNNLNTH